MSPKVSRCSRADVARTHLGGWTGWSRIPLGRQVDFRWRKSVKRGGQTRRSTTEYNVYKLLGSEYFIQTKKKNGRKMHDKIKQSNRPTLFPKTNSSTLFGSEVLYPRLTVPSRRTHVTLAVPVGKRRGPSALHQREITSFSSFI